MPKKPKIKAVKPVKGWVEIDEETKQIVVGRLGLKVFSHQQDIKAAGFYKTEIIKVLITPLPVSRQGKKK